MHTVSSWYHNPSRHSSLLCRWVRCTVGIPLTEMQGDTQNLLNSFLDFNTTLLPLFQVVPSLHSAHAGGWMPRWETQPAPINSHPQRSVYRAGMEEHRLSQAICRRGLAGELRKPPTKNAAMACCSNRNKLPLIRSSLTNTAQFLRWAEGTQAVQEAPLLRAVQPVLAAVSASLS